MNAKQDLQNSLRESNRVTEIVSSSRRIFESANATCVPTSVFSSRFLILLDFIRYVYEFTFREKSFGSAQWSRYARDQQGTTGPMIE